MKFWKLCIGLVLFGVGCTNQGNVLHDFDDDGSLDADDCAPSDPLIHPGADDLYGDGVDQDCDGADGDASDLDNDGHPNDSDCAPEDAGIYPGAEDLYGDGVDQDCDGADGDAGDLDNDGHPNEGDCAPEDAGIYPGAPDPYGDGIDQDCDGGDGVDLDGDGYPSNLATGEPLLDCNDSDAALNPADQDSDGYSSCAGDCNDLDASVTPDDADLDGYSTCDGDCDDSNGSVNPGQVELCDLLDNDCDSSTDLEGDRVDLDADGDPACSDCDDDDGTAETLDRDGDSVSTCGPDGLPDTSDDDCDDNSPIIYPGASDNYGNGLDEDCDGADGFDSDGDGSPFGVDCNDSDASEFPGAPELCNGEVDDCSGVLPADEIDTDGDQYVECAGWVGTVPGVLGGGDCGPMDPGTYPTAPEQCSGIDNDCNGTVDDSFDLDGDGYSPCAGDCDDSDPNSAVAGLGVVTQGGVFVSICAGTFEMGCTPGQTWCGTDEPMHTVTLTRGFWMGETEVTQEQWQSVMGSNTAHHSPNGSGPTCGLDCPMETVTWVDALLFANALSTAEGLAECYTVNGNTATVNGPSGSVYDCEGYRLPTEAEWEYAARAGTDLVFAGSNTIGDVAWYTDNSSAVTHPVATKSPNAWGLYDMSGNVTEWVWDQYSETYYSVSPATDPQGPTNSASRVIRGGNFSRPYTWARVAFRQDISPGFRSTSYGFRLARTAP